MKEKEEKIILNMKINKSDIFITDKKQSIYESQKGIPIPQIISHKKYPKKEKGKRALTETEWANLKNILKSNQENYLKRCIYILEQID